MYIRSLSDLVGLLLVAGGPQRFAPSSCETLLRAFNQLRGDAVTSGLRGVEPGGQDVCCHGWDLGADGIRDALNELRQQGVLRLEKHGSGTELVAETARLTGYHRMLLGLSSATVSRVRQAAAEWAKFEASEKHSSLRSSARVTALMTKPQRHQPMVARPSVVAVVAHGLRGDCHAQPLGPRQVLVVRQEDLDRHRLAIWQVRANLAVAGLDGDELASGRVLRVGREARVRVTHECEVCKVLRGYVPAAVFSALPGQRGSLGVFLRGGAIAVGDGVVVERARFCEVPEGIYDRVAWVLARVPAGRVVTYPTLIALVGASKPYFRVLPTYLRQAAARGLPAHRVLTSAATLTGHLAKQALELECEGVQIAADGTLASPDQLWDGREIYLTAAVRDA